MYGRRSLSVSLSNNYRGVKSILISKFSLEQLLEYANLRLTGRRDHIRNGSINVGNGALERSLMVRLCCRKSHLECDSQVRCIM